MNSDIKCLEIFYHCYLYSANADDTAIFVKDVQSIENIVDFHVYPAFSGLKPNSTGCEVAGLGFLSELKVAVCCMRSISLNTETIRVLAIRFLYNEKLKEEKNFLRRQTNI